MKNWKYIVAATFLSFSAASANAQQQQYRVTFNVENAGQSIGGWTKVVAANELKKGLEAPIINIVDPKSVQTPSQQYMVGFNIKINVSTMNVAKKGYANYLTIMAAYTTTQQINLYNDKVEKDESTLAVGKVVKSILNTRQPTDVKEINTVTFAKLYDITTPRNVEVPFARFALTENNEQSLVTVKFKVEKIN